MSDESLRKAYTYKLKPTPDQARQLEQTVWRCRMRYNTALEERIRPTGGAASRSPAISSKPSCQT